MLFFIFFIKFIFKVFGFKICIFREKEYLSSSFFSMPLFIFFLPNNFAENIFFHLKLIIIITLVLIIINIYIHELLNTKKLNNYELLLLKLNLVFLFILLFINFIFTFYPNSFIYIIEYTNIKLFVDFLLGYTDDLNLNLLTCVLMCYYLAIIIILLYLTFALYVYIYIIKRNNVNIIFKIILFFIFFFLLNTIIALFFPIVLF